MNAIRPPRTPPYPIAPTAKRTTRSRRRSQPQSSQRVMALEAGAKLTVNCFLAIAALSALVKLVPQNFSQQARLQRVRTEVTAAEGRVNLLQDDFSRRFDPSQVNSVMREQSSRVSRGQRPVIWVTPDVPPPNTPAAAPATVDPTAEVSLPSVRAY